MALDMTPEQREIGKANFHRAVGGLAQEQAPAGGGAPNEQPPQAGMTRRGFMKGLLAAGAVLPISAAAYFGYTRLGGRPVRAALIGAGDEGGVLVGQHNPEFLEFIAYSDIRPSNRERIFKGDAPTPNPLWRRGFDRIYGSNAQRRIRRYDDYRELLRNPDIEMVVIALPLHLHAPVAIDAMRAGQRHGNIKGVLCEKLMARSIRQCKEMIRVARETDCLLAIGHQRHYNLLYAQANELMQNNLLGDVRHIRALWHRNNTLPMMDASGQRVRDEEGRPMFRDGWRPLIKPADQGIPEAVIRRAGWRNLKELVRWRLFQRTGGGLMAELGSHQLDACSIFLGKRHPLAVSGVGGKFFYEDDREVEDHVFCSFEFPGKDYAASRSNRYDNRTVTVRDPRTGQDVSQVFGVPVRNDVVVVTYSSVSTNGFEKYGECVMGTKGTMVVEEEQNVMLWPIQGRSTSVAVTRTASGQPTLDTSSTTGGPGDTTPAQTLGQRSLGAAPVSRGYREEMEHMAWIIRMRDQGMSRDREDMQPRCPGKAAMADAIIALAANEAMRSQSRVVFDERWFDPDSPVVPEWSQLPVVSVEDSGRA
jgi:predicted dehydrogenase